MENIDSLLHKVKSTPETISFCEVIALIDETYTSTPTGFKNRYTFNEADQNKGSFKVFDFAQLHDLSDEQVSHLFGDYYRVDVPEHPKNDDHRSIRNFIKFAWSAIYFDRKALA